MADFFEEQPDPQSKVTPTLTQVFKQALESHAADLRVCMPGTIVRYDKDKQLIDVKPSIKRQYRDGKAEDAPVIYNVPVAIPRAGEAYLSMPLDVGHSVTLIFADRSLEKWLSSGKEVDPEDTRKHHISDAIAIPGGYAFSNAAKIHNAKDVIVKNKSSEMRVKPTGRVQFLNDKYEMMKVFEEWMTASINGNHTAKIRIRNKFRSFVEK